MVEKLAPPSQPMRYKTKTKHHTFTPVFPRLNCSLLVFALSSHWVLVTSSFILISRNDCFSFVSRLSVEKRGIKRKGKVS